MITVLVYLLTVHLNVGDYAVPMLPDTTECQRLGQLQTIGRTAATFDCKQYKAVVVSPTGTVPTIAPNSCALTGTCLTTGAPTGP